MTLYEAIKGWMVNYKRTSIKPSSYDRLETSLESLRHYRLHSIDISDLTSNDIQEYINDLVDDGYALTTIKKQLHLIGGYITFANLNGDIVKPLHKGVKIPSESVVKKHKKEVVAYSHFEQEKLLQVLRRGDSPAFYVAILMLETGMRIGEALALGWGDIDWNRKAVRIRKTLVNLGNSRACFVQNEAKSFTSNRKIPLSSEAYNLLLFIRDADEVDSDFIFHDSRGEHLTYEAVRWWIRKACNEANVPYYGQHVFRHTFATNCYEKGCDVKLLSRFLGHSDVMITYNIYIHLFGDALEEMRNVLG